MTKLLIGDDLIHKLEDKMLQLEEANRRLTTLHQASVTLTSIMDLSALLSRVMDVVIKAMGYDRANLFIYDEATKTFQLAGTAGFSEKVDETFQRELVFRLGEERGLVGLVGQTRQALIVEDTARDSRWIAVDETLRSALFVPVAHEEHLLGIIVFLSTEVGTFDEEDARNGMTLASSVAIAIENAQLYKQAQQEITERKQVEGALRESEEKLRVIFQQSMDVIIIIDGESGQILSVNRAIRRTLGYESAALVGKHFSVLFPPEPKLSKEELVKKLHTHGAVFESQEFLRADGSVCPIDLTATLIPWGTGKAILATFRDVTERKQAEEALRHYIERLRTLRAIDGAILAAWSPEEVAQTALRHIRQLVDCTEASIMTFDFETQEATLLAVHVNGEVRLGAGTHLPLEGVVDIATLQQGKALVEDDILPLPSTPFDHAQDKRSGQSSQPSPAMRALQTAGVRSYVAMPLIAQGELIGALTLGAESSGAFAPDHVDIAHEVADQVAVALYQARLHAALEAEEQRLEALVEHLPEGILLLDGERRILLSNPAAETCLAALTDAAVGGVLTRMADRPVEELLLPPPEGLWHKLETPGPPRRVFEVVARPVAAGLKAEGWVLVIRDVTEERETQQRVQQQERLAAVGQLAGGIAHDFNNLLTTIMLYAQMPLGKRDLPPDLTRALETILSESRQAAKLVGQILDFSRRSPIETRPVNLSPFIKETTRILQRTIPESISLMLEVEPGKYIVNADPTRIQQVLMNLVVNARDAMPEGGVLHIDLSRVTIKPGEEPPVAEMVPGGWVCMAISDTGTGIPPDALPHIFEPFFTTKPPGKGTGLGLAQVYGIVKQHEGCIGVETQVGQGTTFRVYLPVHEMREREVISQEGAALAAPRGKGETILLVEDNERIREAGQGILESLGYRVLTAADGREALDVYRSAARVDLVLTDVVMPEMGGKELIRELRRMEPSLKALVITGYTLVEDLEELKKEGILDIVHKPFDVNALAQVVRSVLDGD